MMKNVYYAPDVRVWIVHCEGNTLYSGLNDMNNTTVFSEDLDDDN